MHRPRLLSGDDDFVATDDQYDPDKGVMINKYSTWVAAAVNMRIISIKDLTDLLDTSFASAYAVVEDDDYVVAAESDDTATATEESVYTVASEGAT
jgi:hypothetical protein